MKDEADQRLFHLVAVTSGGDHTKLRYTPGAHETGFAQKPGELLIRTRAA